MSLARVAVDVGQLVLNQWATAPPHKTPQEGRFKTKGEGIFGLAPLIFWVSREHAQRFFLFLNFMLSAPKATALPHLCPRVFDCRPLPHPPIQSRLVGAQFITVLSFLLTHGYATLPLGHTDDASRDRPDRIRNLRPPKIIRSLGPSLHFRPLHQTGSPARHIGTVQLRPTPRLSRFALSHGRADTRGSNSRKLDYRMRSRV